MPVGIDGSCGRLSTRGKKENRNVPAFLNTRYGSDKEGGGRLGKRTCPRGYAI